MLKHVPRWLNANQSLSPAVRAAVLSNALQGMPQDPLALWARRPEAVDAHRAQIVAWQAVARKADNRLQGGGFISGVVLSAPVLFSTLLCSMMVAPLAAPGSAVVLGCLWGAKVAFRGTVMSVALEDKACAEMWISVWNDVGVDVAAAQESPAGAGRDLTEEDRLFGECVLLGRVSNGFATKQLGI